MSFLKRLVLLLCTPLPSSLRLLVWRMLGFRVGRGCRVSAMSIIIADRIELADGCVIAPLVLVFRPELLSMGERARIGGFVRIVGYRGEVRLRAQTFIALGVLIDSTGGIDIGERTQIGPRSMLYSHGECGLTFNMRYPRRTGPIRIGSDCWLPMGCLVGPDLTIGDGVVVLPGLTIRGDVPPATALLPPSVEHRRVPARLFQSTVSDSDRQRILEEVLCNWARRRGGELSADPHEPVWTLRLSGGALICLLRPGAEQARRSEVSTRKRVVWSLFKPEQSPNTPLYCFEELKIYGPWNALTNHIADVLCEDYGAHFVFAAESF